MRLITSVKLEIKRDYVIILGTCRLYMCSEFITACYLEQYISFSIVSLRECSLCFGRELNYGVCSQQ